MMMEQSSEKISLNKVRRCTVEGNPEGGEPALSARTELIVFSQYPTNSAAEKVCVDEWRSFRSPPVYTGLLSQLLNISD